MKQCSGSTAQGRQCKKNASSDSKFCHIHTQQNTGSKVESLLRGGAIGGLLTAHPVGALIGAFVYAIAADSKAPVWQKKRVFVSFDFDQDRSLKHLLVAQAAHPNSPFEIIDASLKEAAPDHQWVKRARNLISDADLVLVLLGRDTYRASGVRQEVAIARELNIPIVQLTGYTNFICKPVQGGGHVYNWTWDNLDKIFAKKHRK